MNPARSHAVYGTPDCPADSCARTASWKAGNEEFWSPAQKIEVDCAPAVPARLKIVPSGFLPFTYVL